MNARPEARPAPSSPPDVFRDLLRLGLGLLVGALTLWLALRGAALGGLRAALGRADIFWILAGSPLRARGSDHQMAKCRLATFHLTKPEAPTNLERMEVQFPPEIEAEITRRASSAGKNPAEVVQEMISTALADEARFLQAVEQGFAELDAGHFVTHEEVGKRIERRFR